MIRFQLRVKDKILNVWLDPLFISCWIFLWVHSLACQISVESQVWKQNRDPIMLSVGRISQKFFQPAFNYKYGKIDQLYLNTKISSLGFFFGSDKKYLTIVKVTLNELLRV